MSIKKFPLQSKNPWERYRSLLPTSSTQISFNEQKTPLIHAKELGKKYNIGSLWIKDEGKNPSGSFKDKETAIALNVAYDFGIQDIVVTSSGNAAVSTAAYAKKGGFNCLCVVSKNLSFGKRMLLNLYGAEIESRDGSYEDMYKSVIDTNNEYWNVTPGYNPYRDEGIKIIGFEIWEDIGVPDTIVVPCGNGTLLFGLYKAFWELQQIGKINTLPQFIGVQISGGAPIAKALQDNSDYAVLPSAPESIAEGIIATESFSSQKAISAIRNTQGTLIEVTDDEVITAMHEVISLESIIPEPTAASVYAALPKIKNLKNKYVIVIHTAGGLKNLKEIINTTLANRLQH